MRPPPVARIAMAFAVSIGEPPPKPIRQSWLPDFRRWAPVSMTVSTGSGTVSLNTAAVMPAASRGSRQRRIRPEETMKGSLTTRGRDRPNFFSTSATCCTAPPATSSMRGAAMLALTVVMGGPSPGWAWGFLGGWRRHGQEGTGRGVKYLRERRAGMRRDGDAGSERGDVDLPVPRRQMEPG